MSVRKDRGEQLIAQSNGQFSLDNYRFILMKALSLGYHFQTFFDYMTNPDSRVLLLRHDIDVSLEYALTMARCEHELGVRSTYFIRLHANGYNPFDRLNHQRLQELVNLGFEIGLHQEVYNFKQNHLESVELLKRSKSFLEFFLEQPVYGVSSHLPKRNTFKITPEILQMAGFRYDPGGEIFNREALFISDSNGHWKPFLFEDALGLKEKILACIHPIWWLGKNSEFEGLVEFLKGGN